MCKTYLLCHKVLPGITGLWQVSVRSDIDNFEDVLRLDIRYIENWSLWLDLQIILKTIQVILKKSGAY
jgi:lipopolysaccharide/colanic/teichoic acid biosynthesis glycosyltransferase